MSELKAKHVVDVYDEYSANPTNEAQVYLKSEADKVIAELQKQVHDYAQGLYVIQARADKDARHQKYKRCLAMAKWCDDAARLATWDANYHLCGWYNKWMRRWLKIAEQFKEAK